MARGPRGSTAGRNAADAAKSKLSGVSVDGDASPPSASDGQEKAPEWVQLAYGQAPSRRYSHAACPYAGGMVVVGGCDESRTQKGPLPVSRFSVQPSPSWDGQDTAADTATYPLTQHCVCVNTAQDAVFIVGGWNPVTCKRKHPVWMLKDGSISQCDERFTGAGPGGVTFSAASCHKNTLYVFGGCTRELENTLWYVEADGGSWGSATAGSSTPSKRSSHCMASVTQGLVVHGGRSEQGAPLGDAYLYEADVSRWVALPSSTGAVQPAPRYGHVMASYGTKVYIHGGVTHGGLHLDDLYELDVSTEAWVQISAGGTPSPRSYHSLVFACGTLCLFGGRLGPPHPSAAVSLVMSTDAISFTAEESADKGASVASDELHMLRLLEDEV